MWKMIEKEMQNCGGRKDQSPGGVSSSKQESWHDNEAVKKSLHRPLRRLRKSVMAAPSVSMRYLVEKERKEGKPVHPTDLFFRSTAAIVKQFSPYYQNVCKTKVFNGVSDLEMTQILEQIPSASPQTPMPGYTTVPESFQLMTVVSPILPPSSLSYVLFGNIDNQYQGI